MEVQDELRGDEASLELSKQKSEETHDRKESPLLLCSSAAILIFLLLLRFTP